MHLFHNPNVFPPDFFPPSSSHDSYCLIVVDAEVLNYESTGDRRSEVSVSHHKI